MDPSLSTPASITTHPCQQGTKAVPKHRIAVDRTEGFLKESQLTPQQVIQIQGLTEV